MDKVVCKAMYIGLIKKLANCPNTDLLRQFLAELNLRARRKNADFGNVKQIIWFVQVFKLRLSKNINNNINNIILILLL